MTKVWKKDWQKRHRQVMIRNDDFERIKENLPYHSISRAVFEMLNYFDTHGYSAFYNYDEKFNLMPKKDANVKE